jgi:hypothetical protein
LIAPTSASSTSASASASAFVTVDTLTAVVPTVDPVQVRAIVAGLRAYLEPFSIALRSAALASFQSSSYRVRHPHARKNVSGKRGTKLAIKTATTNKKSSSNANAITNTNTNALIPQPVRFAPAVRIGRPKDVVLIRSAVPTVEELQPLLQRFKPCGKCHVQDEQGVERFYIQCDRVECALPF